MTTRSMLISIGAGLALAVLSAAAASAQTKSPAMTACSDQWSQMKTDNKIPSGTTWPKFWSQCSKDYAAAHPSDGSAPAVAPAAAAPAAAPTMAASAGKSPAMAACSDQWSQMKADNKVPSGTTWPKFWSQCSKDYAAAHPADGSAPAVAPAAAAPAPAAKTKAKSVADEAGVSVPADADSAASLGDKTKAKRELTPGQQAAVKRIRACGAEWQATKAAGKLPAGAKWPQYWSECNKRKKAAGM